MPSNNNGALKIKVTTTKVRAPPIVILSVHQIMVLPQLFCCVTTATKWNERYKLTRTKGDGNCTQSHSQFNSNVSHWNKSNPIVRPSSVMTKNNGSTLGNEVKINDINLTRWDDAMSVMSRWMDSEKTFNVKWLSEKIAHCEKGQWR